MKAQIIYDLARQTSWINGIDMHKLLDRLTGDPSPSGNVLIDLNALEKEIETDKELSGMLMGLATFGKNLEAKSFIEDHLGWCLGY